MNNKFDELTKSLAQSVTRRAALKNFGVGIAGLVLACFGLPNKAKAAKNCLPAGMQCWDGFYPEGKGVCRRHCCSGLFSCINNFECFCQ